MQNNPPTLEEALAEVRAAFKEIGKEITKPKFFIPMFAFGYAVFAAVFLFLFIV